MAQQKSATLTWLIVCAVLIAGGVAAYFVGGAIQQAAGKQRQAAAAAQVQAAQSKLTALKSVEHLLAANVWAYRAAVALDDRNFGLANDDVGKVVASLKLVDAATTGIDPAALTGVRNEAAAVAIPVATNLEPQRSQLLRLAADITTLTDTAAAKAGEAL